VCVYGCEKCINVCAKVALVPILLATSARCALKSNEIVPGQLKVSNTSAGLRLGGTVKVPLFLAQELLVTDGRTDGRTYKQTDTERQHIHRAGITSCGKNRTLFTGFSVLVDFET